MVSQFKRWGSGEPLDERGYAWMLFIFWVYAVLWFVALVGLGRWNISIYIKVPIYLVMIFGTPTIEDLFKSYPAYLAWHKEYVKRD